MKTSRRGKPIVIADSDRSWPERFEAESELISRACGREVFVAIEHVGSTAVPGLAAKSIIDLMPGVRSLDDAAPLIQKLAIIGYEYVPEYEREIPFRRYFRKDVNGERAFHLHIVEVGGSFWKDHLLFRDYLRSHPADAASYERLKRELAARYNATLASESNPGAGYTEDKSEFIKFVLAKAKEES